MRGYEMGFFDNKTVTLFNRSFNAETEEEKYYTTLLEGVDLVETKGANVSKSGMDSADAVKLYIDFANLGKTLKPYLPPKAWDVLPEESAYEWMHENFDDVYKVTTIDKYEDILPHFEVGGV